MKLEVSLSPALYSYRTIKSHHVTVAVDILRATTAVCAAFKSGCKCIVPLDNLDVLPQYSKQGYMLAAERNGSKVRGAEYGNSPTEYLRGDMSDICLAYSTTNGTVTILQASDADLTLVGAFANLSALTDRILSEKKDVVVLCSGWKNDFCIEDTLFAGALIEKLGFDFCGDAAHMAHSLWQHAKGDPYAYCKHASHVARLEGLGVADDISFSFQIDTCPLVPILKDGKLTV